MPRPAALVKRALIVAHRWLGVALSLVFLLWFVSGFVMMYRSFPGVTDQDRLARAPTLDPGGIRVSVTDAYATLGSAAPPRQVQVTSFDGRPVYRFGSIDGDPGPESHAIVYADDGTVHRDVDGAMVARAASRWTGKPAQEAQIDLIDEVDQWTVGGLQRELPLYKYSWPDGQQVYVNDRTAQVVQYTTPSSRMWAYLGAIPHWLYFTPLRKHQAGWSRSVVWVSLIGTIAVLMGLVIAVWMYSPTRPYVHGGAPTGIPYRGWKRWHMVAGLIFGVGTATWTFSGLLSMGPFPIVNRLADLTVSSIGANDEPVRPAIDALDRLQRVLLGAPLPLSAYSDTRARTALASITDIEVKRLDYASFADMPVYVATGANNQIRIVPVGNATPLATFDPQDLMARIRPALGDELADLRLMHDYDAYYLDRWGRRPLPVIYVRLTDPGATRYYVDPRTASVVGRYTVHEWSTRWLYHGLHSLDFPWLYKHRPLWDIVVIVLLLGGTALCVTSIVLTWRVLARKVSAAASE